MFQYQEDDEREASRVEESEVEFEKKSLPRKRQRCNMRLRKRLKGSEGMFNEEYSDSDFEDGNKVDASYSSEEEDIDLSEAEEIEEITEEEEDSEKEIFEATTIHETKESQKKYKKWTSQDDEALRNSVNKYGYGYWEEIATEVQGTTPELCESRWATLKRLSPNPWKKLEDSKLRELVEKHGSKRKWTVISEEMKGRSATQCQERWREIDHKQPPSKNRKTALKDCMENKINAIPELLLSSHSSNQISESRYATRRINMRWHTSLVVCSPFFHSFQIT